MNTDIIIYFITYFILYSFAGWMLESISKTVEQKKIVNSGFLIGPICPIYGFGALIMLLCLNFLKEEPIILFIAAFFILSLWEYIVGVLLEKIFHTKYWDYSHLKFNFQGRVCLKNSIYWAMLGVFFICFLHPFIENHIKILPINLLIYIDIIIGIAILVDLVFSLITVETMLKKVNELGDNIKEKVKELKELTDKNKTKVEESQKVSIEKIIKELKKKQSILKIRMYKQAIRLKNAFPSMKSETITKVLNQKIDLKKLKESIKKNNKE